MKRTLTVRVTEKDNLASANSHRVLFQWTGELDFDADRLVAFLEGRRPPRVRKPKAKEATP